MFVIKRDGRKEPLNIENIRKQTIPACEGLEGVSYEALELASKIIFTDGIKTSQIQEALIKTAMGKIDIDAPNWTYVAARLMTYELYHNIKRLYNITVSGDVYKLVSLKDYIIRNKHLLSDWTERYTDTEIEELNNVIDSSRDNLYTFPGAMALMKRYLLIDTDQIVELPQHMHMGVAMFVAQNEKDKVYWAKKYYDKLSKLKMIAATPINANGRKKNGATASCLVTAPKDNLNSIMDWYSDLAQGSKLGAGHGADVTRLRSVGSSLMGIKNRAGGKIPFLKVVNDILLAVNQAGVRAGAGCMSTEVWDLELFDFLDLRKRQGEDRRRAQDLFLAISIPTLFIQRIKKNQDWTLFDPADVSDLTDLYGEEFNKRYEEYEAEFKANPDKFNPGTRIAPIKEILEKIVYSWTTEGLPFMFFKDNVNNAHLYFKELGIIRSGNLCMEFLNPVDDNETAVCNLGSINIPRLEDENDIIETSQLLLRFLDSVIDVTEYSTEKAKRTQAIRRATGIGTIGEAEYMAVNKIHYASKEHEEWCEWFYKLISDTIYNYSKELAVEKGGCKVDPSIRNAYRMCIAPNTSSGLLAGSTPSHEPVFSRVYAENSKLGTYKITAPNINIENIPYYKNAFEIPVVDQLRMVSIRQKYIDMGISNSLYVEDVTAISSIDVIKYIVKAHDLGLKTLYYFRTKAKKNDKVDQNAATYEIKCEGCEN